jgi:Zn-dependent protease
MNLHRRGGLSLGRILGIPVRVHWTWLLVLALVAASLAFGYFPLYQRAVAPSSYLFLGGITAALFCASLLVHELAHAVVARREEIPVRGITLWAFGGVAELADQPRSAGAEFRMAVVGPLTSLALAWLFSVLAGGATSPYFALPLLWLARTNLVLGLFNLVPAFPLDGGRVFRSALWALMGELPRATRVAAGVGQVVSWGLVGVGLLSFLRGGAFNGLWLVLVASFIRNAAAGELAYVERAEREAALRRAALLSPVSLSPAPTGEW